METNINNNTISEKTECTCNCNKQATKDYILRAQKNYRQRKLANDPNYAELLRQKQREYIEKNKDKVNEKMKLYMREYRAKKKAEKKDEQTTESQSAKINEPVG